MALYQYCHAVFSPSELAHYTGTIYTFIVELPASASCLPPQSRLFPHCIICVQSQMLAAMARAVQRIGNRENCARDYSQSLFSHCTVWMDNCLLISFSTTEVTDWTDFKLFFICGIPSSSFFDAQLRLKHLQGLPSPCFCIVFPQVTGKFTLVLISVRNRWDIIPVLDQAWTGNFLPTV